MTQSYRVATLLVAAIGAAAFGAICLASQQRRRVKAMPRKPEDLSRWESEGGAPRPEHMDPPVE